MHSQVSFFGDLFIDLFMTRSKLTEPPHGHPHNLKMSFFSGFFSRVRTDPGTDLEANQCIVAGILSCLQLRCRFVLCQYARGQRSRYSRRFFAKRSFPCGVILAGTSKFIRVQTVCGSLCRLCHAWFAA